MMGIHGRRPRCYLRFARRCSPQRHRSPSRPSAVAKGPPRLRRRSRVGTGGGHARTVELSTSRSPHRGAAAPGPTYRCAGGQGCLDCHGREPVPPRPSTPCHARLAAVREREGGFAREEGRQRMDAWTA